MARKDPKLLDMLVTLTMLPWWISVALAAVVFAFLRYMLPTMDAGNPILNDLLQMTHLSSLLNTAKTSPWIEVYHNGELTSEWQPSDGAVSLFLGRPASR